MASQVHRGKIHSGLSYATAADLMKTELDLGFVHRDPQIAIINVVVMVEHQALRCHSRLYLQISNILAEVWLLGWLAFLCHHQAIHVVPAVSAHNKRNLKVLSA